MIRRYTDDILTAILAAKPSRPLVMTPHASYAPSAVDWLWLRRSARLAIGAAICAIPFVGHDWECHVHRHIRSTWCPGSGTYMKTHYRDRRRHCTRCDLHQTREERGVWTDAN